MLENEAFSSTAKVDRYGRKLAKEKGRKDLEKFYRVEKKKAEKSEVEDLDEQIDDDDAVERELKRLGRQEKDTLDSEGGSDVSESSSEEDEDSDLDDADEDDNEVLGLLEEGGESREGIPKGEVSSRLAIVNLDWDNIRATDLMAVFQSFVPTSGRILSIAIFPSEFGKGRMEREELEGPPKEIFAHRSKTIAGANESDDEEDADDDQIKQSLLKVDDGAEFSSARLRQYQLSRLRYYYAVVVCSSSSVASAIYDAVDGTEYLTTANFFDLRYIPNETTFDDDTPRDECTKLPDGYRPNEFVTEALQHSKVKLTWDADDGARKEVQKRAFGGSRKDVDENDLRAYLGSDSEKEEDKDDDDDADDDNLRDDDDMQKPVIADVSTVDGGRDGLISSELPAKKVSKKEAERQRMRALLGLSAEGPTSQKRKAEKAAPVGDMQVTFTSGLSASMEAGKKRSVFENEPEREETTVEKYVRKEKERKARRKDKMKQKSGAGHAEGDDESSNGEATTEKEPAQQQKENVEGEAEEEADLGFNDPFFTTGSEAPPASKTTSSTRKAERQRKRMEREAAESTSALERAQLAKLLAPQSPPPRSDQTLDNTTMNMNGQDPTEINHFNINALSRADKLTAKSKTINRRKHHFSARDKEALGAKAQDTFQMDVADERFRDLYERADFAVDPTHPRFQATEGMKQVLEEGRRKKRRKEEGEQEVYGEGVDRVVDGGERTMTGRGTAKRK